MTLDLVLQAWPWAVLVYALMLFAAAVACSLFDALDN
jgi:hypothetical protein